MEVQDKLKKVEVSSTDKKVEHAAGTIVTGSCAQLEVEHAAGTVVTGWVSHWSCAQ